MNTRVLQFGTSANQQLYANVDFIATVIVGLVERRLQGALRLPRNLKNNNFEQHFIGTLMY